MKCLIHNDIELDCITCPDKVESCCMEHYTRCPRCAEDYSKVKVCYTTETSEGDFIFLDE